MGIWFCADGGEWGSGTFLWIHVWERKWRCFLWTVWFKCSLVQPLAQTVQSWFNPSTVQRVTPDRKANWFNHRFKQCMWMCMLECISESGWFHIRKGLNILGILYCGSLPKPFGLMKREVEASRTKGPSLFQRDFKWSNMGNLNALTVNSWCNQQVVIRYDDRLAPPVDRSSTPHQWINQVPKLYISLPDRGAVMVNSWFSQWMTARCGEGEGETVSRVFQFTYQQWWTSNR